jgi:lanosterol synthase
MVRKSKIVPLTTAVNGHTTSAEKRPIEVDVQDEQPAKRAKLPNRTDYSRWRLLDEKGRQTWHYLEDDEEVKNWPQSIADKYFLGLPTVGSCKI